MHARTLPACYAEGSEGALLGALLLNGSAWLPSVSDLTPAHFSVPNAFVWSALSAVQIAGVPIDAITVSTELRRSGLAERAGGDAHLATLIHEAALGSGATFAHHAGVVREKFVARQAHGIARTLQAELEAGAGLGCFDRAREEVEKLRATLVENLPLASLTELAAAEPDPRKTLLGNRYLCTGGGMLFVGPSGIGKSSASVQQDILWSLGRDAFGIRPARPLRILTVQAENDDGDLGEMSRGVLAGLGLSDADRRDVGARVRYTRQRGFVGAAFLDFLAKVLRQWRPDLLRLDPLLSFLGGDPVDPTVTAAFLRQGLDPLLDRFEIGVIINHHTPKTTFRDTTTWRGSDWMYAGAGSADITNWARAALVIDPTHAGHVFRFIAAKRGQRIGWCDEDGRPATTRHFCHQGLGALCWREATEEDLEQTTQQAPAKGPEDLMAMVPMNGTVAKNELLEKARKRGFTRRASDAVLKKLLEDGRLHPWRIGRPGTNPEVRISRQEQTLFEAAK